MAKNKFTVTDSANEKITSYDLQRDMDYIVPEIRALNYLYTDPLTLCFKFMIDYDKPYGLFADEAYKDSALAYLKRLEGSSTNIRYNMLKNWIENFKALVKYYDFLFLEVSGLSEILTCPAYNMYNEENAKIEIRMRETIDMRVMQIIEGYRNIAYDYERCCDVLPDNLRRFDAHIILYPAAYYNMALYSAIGSNDNDEDKVIRKMLPTLDKINDDAFITWDRRDFNNICFNIFDCEFLVHESGKTFAETIVSENAQTVTNNNITFSYRFANYNGIFNNIRGEVNLVEALAQSSAQSKAANALNIQTSNVQSENTMSTGGRVKNYFKGMGSEIASSAKYGVTQAKDFVKNSPRNIKQKVMAKNGALGNAYQSLSGSNIGKMIKNTVDLGLNKIEDKYINSTLAKLNNLVGMNFNDNLFDFFKNEVIARKGKYTAQSGTQFSGEGLKSDDPVDTKSLNRESPSTNGIKLMDKENIYNRKGF